MTFYPATTNQKQFLADLCGIQPEDIRADLSKADASHLLDGLYIGGTYVRRDDPRTQVVRDDITLRQDFEQDKKPEQREKQQLKRDTDDEQYDGLGVPDQEEGGDPEGGAEEEGGQGGDQEPPRWQDMGLEPGDVRKRDTQDALTKATEVGEREDFRDDQALDSASAYRWDHETMLKACDEFGVHPHLYPSGVAKADAAQQGQGQGGGQQQGGQGGSQGGDQQGQTQPSGSGTQEQKSQYGDGGEGEQDGAQGGENEGQGDGQCREGEQGEGGEGEGGESSQPPEEEKLSMEAIVRRISEEVAKEVAAGNGVDEDAVRRICRQVMEEDGVVTTDNLTEAFDTLFELIQEQIRPTKLEVKVGEKEPVEVDGLTHAAFKKTMKLAAMRKNICLIGPAGCGKSRMAEQVAEGLGLQFAFINASEGMSESNLDGRLLPTGEGGKFEFSETDFIRIYEGGGVFLLDEIDAADANVLIVLHAALANGHMALPKRVDNPIAKKHEDFVMIASANTYGTGANRMYVGRNQLDEATLDRFRIGQIEMDYDKNLEKALIQNEKLLKAAWKVRDKVNTQKLRRIVSTRFILDAQDMIGGGAFSQEECFQQLVCGWSEDERNRAGVSADGQVAA